MKFESPEFQKKNQFVMIKMCISEPISWITLVFGVGMAIFTGVYYRTPMNWAVMTLIIFLLIMQLADALSWRAKRITSPRLAKFGAQLGFIANLLQPLVVFGVLIIVTPAPMWARILATALVFLYVGQVLYKAPAGHTILNTPVKCGHLNYSYWDKIGGWAYLLALIGVILLLVQPFGTAMIVGIYILLALLISSLFYSNGVMASMWCLFAAFLPVLIFLIQLYPPLRMSVGTPAVHAETP